MIGERLALVGLIGGGIVFGGVILSLYAGKAAAEKDLGVRTTWAVNVCAAGGVPFRDDPRKPDKFVAKKDWGKACEARIRVLATNAANAAQAALGTIVAHDAEQDAKAAADRPAARRSAARIQTGQQQMETAIDHSQDGHLGPDYFDGLNRSLGLRPYIAPGAADANGGGQGEGQAGRVVDGLQ